MSHALLIVSDKLNAKGGGGGTREGNYSSFRRDTERDAEDGKKGDGEQKGESEGDLARQEVIKQGS